MVIYKYYVSLAIVEKEAVETRKNKRKEKTITPVQIKRKEIKQAKKKAKGIYR